MDIFAFFDTLLWPIKWAIEVILVAFHTVLEAVGMDPDSGLTWVLSIVGLTLVVRAALIPIFVKQIKSQRKMLEVAPELKKIQDKYKGKKDQFSREAMSRETMAMYKKNGTNPLSSCLPLLLQMPVFFGLFTVLRNAQTDQPGVGLLNTSLASSFGHSELFGAPLRLAISTASEASTQGGHVLVIVIASIMVVLMSASQFVTQLQIMSKNQSAAAKESPMFKQQKMLLYVLPLVFAFSGFTFPLGVMFYWLVSNFWTMGQQFLVIRNMPTPGSEAELAREARLAKKRQRSGFTVVEEGQDDTVTDESTVTQQESHVDATGAVIPQRFPSAASGEIVAVTDDTAATAPAGSSSSELDDEGDAAADYIEELLDIVDLDGDIDIEARDGRVYLSVGSAAEGDLRLLAKPETVNALQELTRIAVQTKTGVYSRLILDIGGSRAARQAELALLVDRAIARLDTGAQAASLPPMSSYERKLVHDIVASRGYVSQSEDEGRERHTVITTK